MKIIGMLMIAALFVGLFIYIAYNDGLLMALATYGLVVALAAWCSLAGYLMQGGKP